MIQRKKKQHVKGKTELYAYIRPTNKAWLRRQAKKKELSISRLMDKVCDKLRKEGDLVV